MSGQLLRGASTRIVTYPIRVLIIINSVLFPILLGIIIYLILQFKKPVMDVIDKAKHIEHIIETNIHLGINKVKEIYNNPEKIRSVANIGEKLEKIKDGLVDHITTCINHIIYIQTHIRISRNVLSGIHVGKIINDSAKIFIDELETRIGSVKILDIIDNTSNIMINDVLDNVITTIKPGQRYTYTQRSLPYLTHDQILQIIAALKNTAIKNYNMIELFTHYELFEH